MKKKSNYGTTAKNRVTDGYDYVFQKYIGRTHGMKCGY